MPSLWEAQKQEPSHQVAHHPWDVTHAMLQRIPHWGSAIGSSGTLVLLQLRPENAQVKA